MRCHQQVHMVGHQYVGVDVAPMLHRCFAQFLPLTEVIGVVREARLAIIAALHDVLRDA